MQSIPRWSSPDQSLDGLTTLEIAKAYLSAGLSIIPIIADGSKQPAIAWKPYQSHLATSAEVTRWWGKPKWGIAIICGQVSGGLEVIDFDDADIFERWSCLVVPHFLPSLDVFPQIETPSGGRHLYYRARSVMGNTKLALRPRPGSKEVDTLIETRGQGGYVLAPGCPRACHPDGREYRHVAGPSLLHIPQIEEVR